MSENTAVELPIQFIALDTPGYFWNYWTQCVYSIKSGNLKRLGDFDPQRVPYKYRTRAPQNHGWIVSCGSRRKKKFYALQDLEKLVPQKSFIPVIYP